MDAADAMFRTGWPSCKSNFRVRWNRMSRASSLAVPLSSRRSLSEVTVVVTTMKILIPMLAIAMMAGPIYSQNWEAIVKNKRTNPLLAILSGFSRRVSHGNDGAFLLQNIQRGPSYPGSQTQEVLQESHQNDTVHQNVMQGPSVNYGGNGIKPLQSQQVHQQASGKYVVQNVVQGPSIHIPKFELPDIHINHHNKNCDA
ncbi:uncharacterized protein LOC122250344 [Penaeus japonicus]|uniref:uncharacterized protein LOC122250344 n=1 Tax=Penaeus japonicus TaxID=27405 RepID=UPI001C7139CF|nr:uncharacterized protein LOC122250344 [Penaeus japonicus]